MKMRQAFGRLIRTEKDRGVFVVLDRRILERPTIIPIPLEPAKSVEDIIDKALPHCKLRAEFDDRGISLADVERLVMDMYGSVTASPNG